MLFNNSLFYIFTYIKKYNLINFNDYKLNIDSELNFLFFNYINFLNIILAHYFKHDLLEIKFSRLNKKYLNIFKVNRKFKPNTLYLLKKLKNYLNNLMFYNIYINYIKNNKIIDNFRIIFFMNFINFNFVQKNNYYNKFSLYFILCKKKKKFKKKIKYFFRNIFSLFFFNIFIYFLFIYLFIYWLNNIYKSTIYLNNFFLFKILKQNSSLFYIKKLNFKKILVNLKYNKNKKFKNPYYSFNYLKLNKYYLAFNKLNLFKL